MASWCCRAMGAGSNEGEREEVRDEDRHEARASAGKAAHVEFGNCSVRLYDRDGERLSSAADVMYELGKEAGSQTDEELRHFGSDNSSEDVDAEPRGRSRTRGDFCGEDAGEDDLEEASGCR